jgi:2-keto-3-deoxy-L-rhamnonate aldolase RhmA
MKPNAMREKLTKGEVVYGTMMQDIRTPSIGQIMGLSGCDFLFFDMEHGPYDLGVIADMIKVTRLAGVTPLVRAPSDNYHLLARPLDAGAMGVMIPRVETRAQVERIVDSIMYPPVGSRGCSITKGHNDFAGENMWDFTETANQENLVIIQIEREKAVENIEDLVSVEGVGAVILGPNDLALSMGEKSKDFLSALEPAIQHVLNGAKKYNIPCGIHIANLEWLAEWKRRGMQIITYSTDIGILMGGIKGGINQIRDAA